MNNKKYAEWTAAVNLLQPTGRELTEGHEAGIQSGEAKFFKDFI